MVSALASVSQDYRVDRRKFLCGAWRPHDGDRQPPAGPVNVAAILVHTRPERVAETELAIGGLDGIKIQSRDPVGRLMVAVDATDPDAAGTALSAIVAVPGVLAAALVNAEPRVLP